MRDWDRKRHKEAPRHPPGMCCQGGLLGKSTSPHFQDCSTGWSSGAPPSLPVALLCRGEAVCCLPPVPAANGSKSQAGLLHQQLFPSSAPGEPGPGWKAAGIFSNTNTRAFQVAAPSAENGERHLRVSLRLKGFGAKPSPFRAAGQPWRLRAGEMSLEIQVW